MRCLVVFVLVSLVACASVNKGAQSTVSLDIAWRTGFGLGDMHRPNLVRPIVNQGRVYVASAIGYLYAFDAKTGDKVWSLFLDDVQLSGQFVLHEGTLYMPTAGGQLWLIDATQGTVVRKHTTPPTTARPLVVQDMVILQTNSGSVVAIDATSGETRWTFRNTAQGITTFATDSLYALGGVLVVGMQDGRLLLFDIPTGRQLAWAHQLATSDAGRVFARIVSVTSIQTIDDLLVATARNGGAAAFNARTLAPVWQNQTTSSISVPAVVNAQQVVAVRTDASVYAFAPQDGRVLWQRDMSEHAQALTTAVIVGDFVVIGTDEGDMCVLDVATGEVQICESITVGRIGIYMTVDNNLIYLTDEQGFLFAIRLI